MSNNVRNQYVHPSASPSSELGTQLFAMIFIVADFIERLEHVPIYRFVCCCGESYVLMVASAFPFIEGTPDLTV